MATAAIGYINLADAGTLAASSATLLAPISNVQQPDVGRVWQGAAGGADHFVCDLGSAQSINAIALMGLAAATIRVRISATDSSGQAGELYDSGSIAVDQSYLQHLTYLTNAMNGRYIRVDLANGSTDVEAGRLFVGAITSFGINFSWGWQRASVDRSIRVETDGGQTVTRRRTAPRTLDLTFDFLSESEANGFVESIDLTNGLDDDVLFVLDTASTNLPRDFLWGLLTEMTPVSNTFVDIYSKQFKIKQRL